MGRPSNRADLFETPTLFWRRKIAALKGLNWSDLSFFELEFLFYHALNSIAGRLRPGHDIFVATRRAALAAALPRFKSVLDTASTVSLADALLLAALGNEADLSQLTQLAADEKRGGLIIDERSSIEAHLRSFSGDGSIQILLDNAGLELCFDLLVVDILLAAHSAPIVLHAKPHPMFVSDARIDDVVETIDLFCQSPPADLVAMLGQRLRKAQIAGRLTIVAASDWAEPRYMNMLEAELSASLSSADLVIAKGDLNYRRFFEDRQWPCTTPVARVSVAASMRAFALRVLKSESVVGIDREKAASLFEIDPQWRTNGRYSLIQRVDGGR